MHTYAHTVTISSLVIDLFRLYFFFTVIMLAFYFLWNIFHSIQALTFINLFIPKYVKRNHN